MAKFDFLSNRAFDDRFSAFAPQEPQSLPGKTMFDRIPLDTGVKVAENGDVHFALYAPGARQVSVVFGIKSDEPLPMERGDDGIWRTVLPYDPTFCGPKAFEFQVDGAPFVSAYCPQYFSHGMAINYVEIPDPNTPYVLMNDVPHGSVTAEFYWSDPLEAWQRCLVYTPPGYHQGGTYPVLYLQHGAGENETSWVYNGRVGHIMDNLLAEGKIKPFLIVMNNGMARRKDEVGFTSGEAFMRSIPESCIPFIESRYRVKTGPENRAIAGFSMGSMQSSIVGLEHPELFAYIGLLSGFMRRLGPDADADQSLERNPHLRAMLDREKFLSQVKLYYRGIGSEDPHYDAYAQDDEVCAKLGFDQYPNVVRRVVEGYPHDWAVLRILFHDFAQRIFRD